MFNWISRFKSEPEEFDIIKLFDVAIEAGSRALIDENKDPMDNDKKTDTETHRTDHRDD